MAEDNPLKSPKGELEDVCVKEEPLVETGPLVFPKWELEDSSIKEETPEEDNPLMSPKQELEYVSVTGEPLVEDNPLRSPKRELEDVCVKEEQLFLREWEAPDGLDSTQDPLSIKEEDLKDEVESTSSGCAPERWRSDPNPFQSELHLQSSSGTKPGTEQCRSHSPASSVFTACIIRNRRFDQHKLSNSPEANKNAIVALHKQGFSNGYIARTMGVLKSTVVRWIQRMEEDGNLKERPHSGASRKTTAAQDRQICRFSENHPFVNARLIQQSLIPAVSSRTVNRRLREGGLIARNTALKEALSVSHRGKRQKSKPVKHFTKHWGSPEEKQAFTKMMK